MNDVTLQSSINDSSPIEDQWRIYLVIFAIALTSLLIAYWGTVFNIVMIWWHSKTFNHGFLIIPISLYLIWQRKNDIIKLAPRPALSGWILLFLLVVIWLISSVADVQLVQQIAVIMMIPVLVYVLLGLDIVKATLFPLTYLIFAIPMGEFLVPLLQDITAIFTVETLKLVGIPVHIEGRYIFIPSGKFRVAEACSGIRYLIASVALGTLYAYLTYYSQWRRLIFILLSIVVPVMANSIRAFGIVMLAHSSDYKLATGFDHLIYGWVFFGLVMLALFWAGSFFRDKKPMTRTLPPTTWSDKKSIADKKTLPYILLVTIVLLLSAPVVAQYLQPTHVSNSPIELPKASNQWGGPVIIEIPWQPAFEGATTQLMGEYTNDTSQIQLYIAYYAVQKQGAELINSKNKLFDDKNWRRVAESKLHFEIGDQGKFSPKVLLVSSKNTDKVLWVWYEVFGTSTSDPLETKLADIKAKLTGKNLQAAAVIIGTDHGDNEEIAQNNLKRFVIDMLPNIKHSIASHEVDKHD